MPGSWLDLQSRVVRAYVGERNLDTSQRLLPPHTLFYHDALQDVKSAGMPVEGAAVPDNALYDTLPGSTREEKFAYLKDNWGKHKDQIKYRTTAAPGGCNNYNFSLIIDGRQYSLTLFGQFPDENWLAQQIYQKIQGTSG